MPGIRGLVLPAAGMGKGKRPDVPSRKPLDSAPSRAGRLGAEARREPVPYPQAKPAPPRITGLLSPGEDDKIYKK